MLITEFAGLTSKMYSYIKENNKERKTCKDIKKSVVNKDIRFGGYKSTLFNSKQLIQ